MSVKKLNKEVAKKIKRVLLKVSDETSLEKVIEDLYDLATQDLKTGLLNFTAFSKILDLEAEQAKRGKQKLTLIVLDIDFFKKINDTYGHIKADELLSRLANILKKTVRKGDILARFGGEEFVILLPETSLNKSKKLVKRIQNNIEKDKILLKYSLTLSGGATSFKISDNLVSFQERADKALYLAKNTGRNRVVFR